MTDNHKFSIPDLIKLGKRIVYCDWLDELRRQHPGELHDWDDIDPANVAPDILLEEREHKATVRSALEMLTRAPEEMPDLEPRERRALEKFVELIRQPGRVVKLDLCEILQPALKDQKKRDPALESKGYRDWARLIGKLHTWLRDQGMNLSRCED